VMWQGESLACHSKVEGRGFAPSWSSHLTPWTSRTFLWTHHMPMR